LRCGTQFALQALDRVTSKRGIRATRSCGRRRSTFHTCGRARGVQRDADARAVRAGVNYEQTVATGWHHSEWTSREVLQVGVDKVHAAGQWQRFSEDGRALATNIVTYADHTVRATPGACSRGSRGR
jgi:hypothetical protein